MKRQYLHDLHSKWSCIFYIIRTYQENRNFNFCSFLNSWNFLVFLNENLKLYFLNQFNKNIHKSQQKIFNLRYYFLNFGEWKDFEKSYLLLPESEKFKFSNQLCSKFFLIFGYQLTILTHILVFLLDRCSYGIRLNHT